MVDGVNQKDLLILSRHAYGLPEDPDTVQHSPTDNFFVGAGSYNVWNGYKWTKQNWRNLGNLKTVEQGLKGNNVWETIGNFNRNSKLNQLSNMYKEVQSPVSFSPAAPQQQQPVKQSFFKRMWNNLKKLTKKSKAAAAPPNGPRPANPNLNRQIKDVASKMHEYNKSRYYDEVRRLVEEARGLKGKRYEAKLNQINKAIIKANAEVHKAKVSGNLKPVKLRGKIGAAVKKGTGINALINKTDKVLSKSKGLQKVVKFSRGKGVLTAIAVVPEAINIANTYSQLGTSAGNRQLVKSSLVIGAELGTYALGMKAGASLGAAIGSVIPGAGTIVGGILGAAIGLAGSYFAGKAMEKAVGKPELEIAADKQAEEAANVAAKNTDELENLLISVQNSAGEDINNLPENVKPAFVKAVNAYYEAPAQESETSQTNTTQTTSVSGSPQKTAAKVNPKELSETLKKTKAKLLAFAEAMEKPLYGQKDDWSSPSTFSPFSMMNTGMMPMFNPSMNFGGMTGSYIG